MTRKFWVLLGFVYVLIFLGLVTMNSGLVALALPLLVYLGVGIYYAPGKTRFSLKRHLSCETVGRGGPVDVTLEITNQGSEIEQVLLEDTFPARLQLISGENSKSALLQPGGKVELKYTVSGERGLYKFEEVWASVSHIFGLYQTRFRLTDPAQLLILPESLKLRRVNIRPQQTRGFAGSIPSRVGGSGTDFWGVREYQVGDPLRKINWRASARHTQELFTNEYEQERIADVGLILDARQQMNLVTPAGVLFEYSVLAIASLAETFIKDGNRVSLLTYGYGIDRVFPGYGKVQQERIFRALARARTGVHYAMESLNYLPTRLFSARSQIVMISPLGQEDLPAYIRLRSQGYEILLVSPDPVDFEARAYGMLESTSFAVRLARIERSLLLRKLKHLGVRTVDWKVDHPLDEILYTSLRRQPIRNRLQAIAI